MRNRPLTCNIPRYQEERRRTSLLKPFPTLFHLSDPGRLSVGSHHILLLSSPFTISTPSPNCTLLALARLPPISSIAILHFTNALSSKFCALSSQCKCSAHSFLFASQRYNSLASSSSFFKICAPPLHAVSFNPALPSALLII